MCTAEVKKCYRCGKHGHVMSECEHKEMVCFNYGEEGHIGSKCTKPKKDHRKGKIFALAGTAVEHNLIQGTCFINSTPLIAIIDIGETHCFIAAKCVERLNLELTSMNGEMVIELPAMGSINTTLACRNYPLSIFDRDFVVNLI